MSTGQEILAKLQEPFPPEDIEWRVGATNNEKTQGIALAYITNRAIQARLDEVFGPFGWQNQYKEWKGTSQICGISVWDNEKQQWITKWDGADDSATEAVKGGLSDSMKRAGYQWGIGRYLYNLENVWAPIEKRGNSYILKSEPKLPAWALPGGSGKPTQPSTRPDAAPLAPAAPPPPAQPATPPKQDPLPFNGQDKACNGCGVAIGDDVYGYSKRVYSKPLCRNCQKTATKTA
jgi:hypothetical protein